jgi:H+/Cl- antiporter ClcA
VHETFPHVDRPLLGLVAVVGLFGGLIGAAYVSGLHLLERIVGPGHHVGWAQVAVLVVVGALIGVLTRALGDPGDVELLVDNIHVAGGSQDARALRSLLPVSLIGIAAGSALGPEAPLVQTGGVLGTRAGIWRRLDKEQTRVLAICGMASAFAVLFGAPLGSAVFALEILHRRGLEYYEALLPALGGAFVGFAVFTLLEGVGYGPLITLPSAASTSTRDLLWGGVAAVVGACLAAAFTLCVSAVRVVAGKVPGLLRPAVGGLVLGLLSLWSFAALTFGEAQISLIGGGGFAASTLAAAVVAKLVGSAVCLATGWRGGFIIPLFFAGAAAGQLLHLAIPSADPTVLMAACMVATNVGVTKTPVGSTLVVAKMAGLQLLPSTTLAAIGSMLLTNQVNLIASQRRRAPSIVTQP